MFSTLNRRSKEGKIRGGKGGSGAYLFHHFVRCIAPRNGQTKARQEAISVFVHFVSLRLRWGTLLRELCMYGHHI